MTANKGSKVKKGGMSRAEIDKEIEGLTSRIRKAKEVEDGAYKAFMDVINHYFPERTYKDDGEEYKVRDDYLVFDKALARALYDYTDRNYDYSVFPLPFEWLLASYVTLVFKTVVPKLLTIKAYMELHKHSERNPFDWNDIDNYCCYMKPRGGRSALLFTAQSYRFLVIFEYATGGTLDKVHFRELAAREPRYFGAHTLRFYKQTDFKVKYGDCRDSGYMLTWESPWESSFGLEMPEKKVDRPEINMSLLKAAVFDIECLVGALKEENQKG